MANFFISDLHIGHANVIRFDQRPFANLSKMHEATLKSIEKIESKINFLKKAD